MKGTEVGLNLKSSVNLMICVFIENQTHTSDLKTKLMTLLWFN